MNQFHWLPIQARIDFKIATLTNKALSSGQPAYLRELISPYKPSRQLRSSDQSLLTISRTNLTILTHPRTGFGDKLRSRLQYIPQTAKTARFQHSFLIYALNNYQT